VRHARLRAPQRPTAIGSVASDTLPLRVHWQRPGDDALAAEILADLEHAWSVQVDQLGFRPPVLPDGVDGPDFDAYLAPVGALQAWVQPQSWQDTVQGDGYDSVPTFMVIDQDLPEAYRASYAAHEFNHALQFATDANEQTLTVWEATAVSAQKWTLGDAGDWAADVRYFQEAPWAPTLTGDSYTLWYDDHVGWNYEYGAALWLQHLDEVLGDGDGAAGPALWDALAQDGDAVDEPDVVDAVQRVSGQDLGTFLNGVARTRWLTGPRWTSAGLSEAADWDPTQAVPIATELQATDLPADVTFEHGPMIDGQAFVTLDTEHLRRHVTFTVAAPTGSTAALALVGRDASGWHALAEDTGATPVVQLDPSEYSTLAAAVTWLGPDTWDGDDDPYIEGDLVLHVDAPTRTACGCATGTRPTPAAPLLLLLLLCRKRGGRGGVRK